jgi:acyl-CoA thioesterase-1
MSPRQARTATAAAVAVSCLCLACGSGNGASPPREAAKPDDISSTSTSAVANRPRIVVLGDSLTAGLGLSQDDAYPALLQRRIDAAGLNYSVVNAGVSGDTSAGGLSRLDWALGEKSDDVRILIVALGGNDGLRALPVEELERNLATIIERAQARHVRVILAGMDAPPNFGESYTVSFHQVYPRLAAKYRVPLIPFLLQGVAGIDTLNQRDGIHPTPAGAQIVADNVWAALKPTIESQPK